MTSENKRDEKIISALMCNPTVRAAAAALNVSEGQIYTRLRSPDFKKKYAQARREVLEQSTAYLQGIVGDALLKIYEIMTDPDNAPTVQLQAAQAITRTALSMTEQVDIMAQLSELREAILPDEQ